MADKIIIDFDVEELLIGSLFYDTTLLTQATDFDLQQSDFGNVRVGWVYKAIQEVAGANDGFFCERSVEKRLEEQGHLADVGGLFYLNTVTSKAIEGDPLRNFSGYLTQVLRGKMRREIKEVGEQLKDIAKNETLSAQDMEDKAQALARQIVNPFPTTSNIKPFSQIIIEDYERTSEIVAGTATEGWSTPFYDLDKWTGGDQPGNLTIWGGKPSSGKSSVMFQCASHHVRNDIPVLYITIEMPEHQMSRRGLAQDTGVSRRQLTHKDHSGFEAYSGWRRDAAQYDKLFMCRMNYPTLRQIDSVTKAAVEEYGVKVVYIDYIQLIGGGGLGTDNTTKQQEMLTNGLKDLSIFHSISINTGSQLGRFPYRRPTMEDLRWGGMEQAPDVVVLIHPAIDTSDPAIRDAHDGPMLDVLFLLDKNRNDERDKDISVLWNKKHVRFDNKTFPHHEEAAPAGNGVWRGSKD